MRFRTLALLTIVALVCVGAPGAAQAPADPPRLSPAAIEALPAAVRARLGTAYETARARPRDASAVGRLAMMLHAYEQHRLAAAYYERAAELDAGTIDWPYLAGVTHAEAGDIDKALLAFGRVLTVQPEHLPTRVKLAAALYDHGDLAASRAAYEGLVAGFPEMALAHYGLGRVLDALGEADAALQCYERAVKMSPQFGRAHYALALAYRNIHVTDKAEHHLRAHRQLGSSVPTVADPLLDEVRSLRGTARDRLVQGARLGAAGRLQDAIALHLDALEADPTVAQAHVNLIALYGRAGRPSEAEEHYRLALGLKGDLAEAHYNFGVLQAASGQYSEALEAFRRALDADPFHPRAHKNVGALLARQKKYDEAENHYRQALATDPQHDSARLGLGEVLVAQKRPREAIQHFEKLLLTDDPDQPRYRYGLAIACLAAGDTARGIAQAEEAMRDATARGQSDLAARIAAELPKMKAIGR